MNEVKWNRLIKQDLFLLLASVVLLLVGSIEALQILSLILMLAGISMIAFCTYDIHKLMDKAPSTE